MTKFDVTRKYFVGVRVDDFDWETLVEYFDQRIRERAPTTVMGISLTQLLSDLQRLPVYIREFDVVTADGKGVVLMGRALGCALKSHLSVPDMSLALLELANKKGYSVYLLGATPEINALACEKVRKQYPNIAWCEGHHGYFDDDGEAEIVKKISEHKPDVLLLGMSSPKKDEFALKWKAALETPIVVACGGFLDVVAGQATLPPQWVQRIALSWFWRFVQEPRRLFKRLFCNALKFVVVIFPKALIYRYILRREYFLFGERVG